MAQADRLARLDSSGQVEYLGQVVHTVHWGSTALGVHEDLLRRLDLPAQLDLKAPVVR